MSKIVQLSILILFFGFTAFYLPSNEDWKTKIASELIHELERVDEVNFIVLMQAQANTDAARILSSKEERANFVYQQVQQIAKRSQTEALAILENENRYCRSFSVVNAIHAKGDLWTLEQLAKLEAVKAILHNPQVQLEALEEEDYTDYRGGSAIGWGIENINADDVWAMGFTGQDVVIGGQDTGFEWEHPALQATYRGWDSTSMEAVHDYNWHDAIREINPLHGDSTLEAIHNPCGLNVPFPCDDHNHGTHTMGTMLGDDEAGNQIGVAPDAKWMACRNMERGWGTPASYIECYEWFIAPTDLNNENPAPSKAPHIINNSWGCPAIEGCDSLHIALMESVVNNVKASGIVVVVSAGNSGGSGCSSVSNPSAIYENSFSVGSIRSNDTISNFSSRGPAIQLDSVTFLLKPNVCAPGQNVRSAIREGEYANFSGTSMAGPHVAGAVALIISANPALAGQVEEIESILEQTARPKFSNEGCGGLDSLTVPNNTYGYGNIDVFAAVEMALAMVSTDALTEANTIHSYPNPFKEVVLFELPDLKTATDLSIFASNGQLIFSKKIKHGNQLETISLKDMPSGIYFYTLKNEWQLFQGKLVKE